MRAHRWAFTEAYKTTFLVSLAFGGLTILANCFIANIDHLMDGKLAATLSGREEDASSTDKSDFVV